MSPMNKMAKMQKRFVARGMAIPCRMKYLDLDIHVGQIDVKNIMDVRDWITGPILLRLQLSSRSKTYWQNLEIKRLGLSKDSIFDEASQAISLVEYYARHYIVWTCMQRTTNPSLAPHPNTTYLCLHRGSPVCCLLNLCFHPIGLTISCSYHSQYRSLIS